VLKVEIIEITKETEEQIIEETTEVTETTNDEEPEEPEEQEEQEEAEPTTEAIVIKPTEEPTEETKNNSTESANVENSNLIYLGKFKLTAYCNCKKCCGKWSGGATASGVMPKVNRTIAVDTKVIPFGTKVVINGKTYVAEDTGSAIKGNKIDIYMSNHKTALNFGVQYAEVFKVVK
jgi:3D (Asp-Asp-Asp) domain-containing protein